MKARKQAEITKLLSISSNLGQTAYDYWTDFVIDDKADASSKMKMAHAKPCVYAFTGVAYQGLQIRECSDKTVRYLQESLRIIDPLYGILRPLDVIQPYRLEMATRCVIPDDQKLKLQDYWKRPITESITQD